MSEISISLSRKSMKLLLKHVFIGNWVLTSTGDESNPELEEFYNKILSIMKNYGIESRIEYDEKINEYYLTRECEEEFLEDVIQYEEDTFWEILTDKLSLRDAFQKYGNDELARMERIKYFEAIGREEEKYNEEFEENGIENLRIQRS